VEKSSTPASGKIGKPLAFYLFCLNMVAIGLGPTLTALITDYVFGYEEAVGQSIAVIAVIYGSLSALVLWSGLKPFRREARVQAQQQSKQ
jgi:hypothetical protein